MSQYKTHNVASTGFARAYILGTLSRNGGVVYALNNSPTTVFEVRETWPNGTTGLLDTPEQIPGTWTRQ